jgi:hypothetical protein
MYYTYRQNNSGGQFTLDKKRGITMFVVIFAETSEEADKKAEDIGLYFNGVEKDIDCGCCGDRWYPNTYEKPTKTPMIYGKTPTKFLKSRLHFRFVEEGFEICIHLKNGKMKWY